MKVCLHFGIMSYGGHGGKIHDLQVAKKLCTGIYVTYNMDLCWSTCTVPQTAFGFQSASQNIKYTCRSTWKASRGMVTSWSYCKPQHKMHIVMSSNFNLWEIAPRIQQTGGWEDPNSLSENDVKEKYL